MAALRLVTGFLALSILWANSGVLGQYAQDYEKIVGANNDVRYT
jgi:hypothetical protein